MGIDAAWTEREPSGVILIADDCNGWLLIGVAASYEAYIDASHNAGTILRHRGSPPDAGAIIAAASSRVGADIYVVTINMPPSKTPIISRRVSDNMM